MISVSQAQTLILERHRLGTPLSVSLTEAQNHILAQDVSAKLTLPPLSASAMDGYAVQHKDVAAKGAELKVIGEAPAGQPFTGRVKAGTAVRIFTGGAIPDGADSVIIQENVTRADAVITIDTPQDAPRHIRPAGLDFHAGDIILQKGIPIGAPEIAVAAAAGFARLPVHAPLRIAIITGGDELVPIGQTPDIGQIVNSNPHALAALISEWGHSALIIEQARDSLESLSRAIKSAVNPAENIDVILAVGGASVGDHDYMRQAFKDAGLNLVFEKIAVRPGKPTWFGALRETTVLGLPGNPASALVCAHLFLKPLLTGKLPTITWAVLGKGLTSNGPRETYQRAAAAVSDSGVLTAKALPKQESSMMTPFLSANALLRIKPDAKAADIGAAADIILIAPL